MEQSHQAEKESAQDYIQMQNASNFFSFHQMTDFTAWP